MGYARVGSNPAVVATNFWCGRGVPGGGREDRGMGLSCIAVHFWPSGLRRYVQVVVSNRRRRFESCGVQ